MMINKKISKDKIKNKLTTDISTGFYHINYFPINISTGGFA